MHKDNSCRNPVTSFKVDFRGCPLTSRDSVLHVVMIQIGFLLTILNWNSNFESQTFCLTHFCLLSVSIHAVLLSVD